MSGSRGFECADVRSREMGVMDTTEWRRHHGRWCAYVQELASMVAFGS